MKKHIAEDLPARKFPQASLSKGSDANRGGGDRGREGGDRDREGGESKTPEKRVRQAVYDIKYRARRENIPLRSAYTQYMQNSSMSEQEKSMVREKLFGKGGIVKEAYLEGVSELASSSVAKALYNVFVEPKTEVVNYNQLKDELEEASHFNSYNKENAKKYKVRVTDNSGVSYVRYATREKINSLRANPNIKEVEMTEYGEPYEGEKKKGERTAAATAGKDWDGDGKKESGAKEYRGVVHNAIQKRKGGTPDGKDTSSVKEEFLGELTDEKTIDVKRGKKNKIVVHHKGDDGKGMNESSYSKFLELLSEKKMTKSEKAKEKKLKKKYDKSGMKASMKKQYGEKGEDVYFATIRKKAMNEESCGTDKKTEDDPRSMPTKVSNFKNKLRAMGLKMSYEPEGEVLDERRREDKGKPRPERNRAVEFVRSQDKKGITTRSGRTIAKHEEERGVPERDRPSEKEETTADRVAAKRQRREAEVARRERHEREEDRRRRLG
jgi:hypothetical protein